MARSKRGLHLYGIPLTIHPSWALAAALIVFTIGGGSTERTAGAAPATLYLGGAAVAALLFASVLFHELAHALVARRRALPVRRITMYVFGGTAELDADALRPRDEAAVAVAGPAASAALAILFGALWWLARGAGGALELALQLLAVTNGAILLMTALPGYPLDGGRVVRAALWYLTDDLLTATRWATLYGQALGWCLFVGGVVLLARNAPAWGLAVLLSGWFLRGEARRGYRQLLWQELSKRTPAGSAAFGRPPRIPATRTLDEAVDDVLEGFGTRNEGGPSVVIDGAGAVIGVLGLDQVRAIGRARWRETTAGAAMVPRARVPAIPPDMTLATALALLSEGKHPYGLVVAGATTEPLGVITPDRIARYLLRRLRDGRRALEAATGGPRTED